MLTSADNEGTVRLFKATSIMARHKGHKNVIFDWLRLNRGEPVLTYQAAIAGYQELDRLDQLHLENFIDEAFTEPEIIELGNYLRKVHRSELVAEELALPLQDIGLADPYSFLAQNKQELYMLTKDEACDLSFPVYGRFDLSQHEPIDEDLEQAQRLGLLYLRESLKALGIAGESEFGCVDGRFSEARLGEVVARLRADQGLEVSALFSQEPPVHVPQPDYPDYMAYILGAYLGKP